VIWSSTAVIRSPRRDDGGSVPIMCQVLGCQSPLTHVINVTKHDPEGPTIEVGFCDEHFTRVPGGFVQIRAFIHTDPLRHRADACSHPHGRVHPWMRRQSAKCLTAWRGSGLRSAP